ncbi:histidine kinase [Streptantibioticus parmotrematis]|uniref:sensor histidine kinase n=1 Tax=Streptantibioticus parmotrematis TaxID=2873249 RepID=UPI0033D430E0
MRERRGYGPYRGDRGEWRSQVREWHEEHRREQMAVHTEMVREQREQWRRHQEAHRERVREQRERHRERHERRRERHELRRAERHEQAIERRKAVALGLRLSGQSLGTVFGLLVAVVGIVLTVCLPFVGPPALRTTRWFARRQRRLLAEVFGHEVPEAYRPALTGERLPGGKFRYGDRIERKERSSWEVEFWRLYGDPASWRDLRWLACAPLLGLVTLVPTLCLLDGSLGQLWVSGELNHVMLAALFVGGWLIAPGSLTAYRRWSVALLEPPRNAALEQRVQRLTETRADAVDTQAAELRRIERDLHDGVQARLVAMGLNLGAVEQLMETDPEAARELLAQSREASANALQELRGLVRGIHPPVLAERGLADAIRALALDSPLTVEVVEDLPGRAEPPVESAVYFAVSELLTNAARHSGAGRVWIDLHHTGDALRVQVTDDGQGGADHRSGSGTGLRGIERRLGTFDGVLALSSPQGGPTIVTLELPCALSSRRTSTC